MRSREDITPCLMIRNEEFWIHYVLKDVLDFFERAIIIDTGSTDDTIKIVQDTIRLSPSPGHVQLFKEHYGSDAAKMGEARNALRSLCRTHWMFLIDGDEIWRPAQLNAMMHHLNQVPDLERMETIMVGGRSVEEVNGRLMLRDGDLFNVDRLFSPAVRWNILNYPFEGHGLYEDRLPRGVVSYIPANIVYCWHMRHTQRSRAETYMRREKIGYFPWPGPWMELPRDWLEPNSQYANPYFVAVQS